MDRRTFLRLAGMSALGAGLAPLSAGASPTRTAARAGLLPGPGPSIDTVPQIRHVVVLMMENHSFDNVLGALRRPGVDGLTFAGGVATNANPDQNGNPVRAFRLPTMCQDGYTITQSWDGSHWQWNGGAMDGFVVTSGVEAMGYYTEAELPVTHALAKTFPVCDRWFCSTMCQTFPNRLFLLAGTSQGSVSTKIGERAKASPPKNGTIFDRLNGHGISWKNYVVDLGDSMLWGPAYFAKQAAHFAPVAEFFVDAALGTLPALSIVDPEAFEASEENPQNVAVGEAFVWAVTSAVLNSPAWHSTALLLTYDEHGGYYDHVPPVPAPNPDGIHPKVPDDFGDDYTFTGFRVPTVLISPWAKPGLVSHTVYDHTSLLAFLETKWGLPPLTARDRSAANMLDLFDFSRPAFAVPPTLPVPNLAAETLNCLRHGQTGVAIP
jgi:phospholipase C